MIGHGSLPVLTATFLVGAVFNVQTSTWTWPSGAKTEFAFLDSPAERSRYVGRAFNTICWDELSEWSEKYICAP